MEQLTEQEKTSQRRVYKWCMATFALEAVLVTAIAIASAVFPKHRTLPAIAGCALFGSFVPLLIALNRIKRLTITQRVDVDVPSLPYKLAKEKTLMYLLSGVVVLISIMMVPEILKGKPVAITPSISLPSWTVLPLQVWPAFGFLFVLISWRGVILNIDHPCQYWRWVKQSVFYHEMKRVEIAKKATGNGGRTYVMAIHHTGTSKSPLEIYLASVPAKDCVVMLNVIQMHSPHVTMNDLALQMKQGEIPMA